MTQQSLSRQDIRWSSGLQVGVSGEVQDGNDGWVERQSEWWKTLELSS